MHEVKRNWGTYKVLYSADTYRVKLLTIDPASALSNQYHNHRSETWKVVKGRLLLQLYDPSKDEQMYEVFLHEGEVHIIEVGTWHRAINPTNEPVEVIEIWTGDQLSEEDIVRQER